MTSKKFLFGLLAATGLTAAAFWRQDEILHAAARTGLLPKSWLAADARRTNRIASGDQAVEATTPAPSNQAGLQRTGGPDSRGSTTATASAATGETGPSSWQDTAMEKTPMGKSGPEMREWGRKILAMKGTPGLNAELDLFLNHITSDNWKEAADAALPFYDFLHHNKWGAVMTLLGAVGGQEAVERFKPANMLLDYEGYGSRNAMKGWAATDRAAARAYLESLPAGRFRDGMGIGFLRSFDEGSAASLEKLYDEFPKTLWPQIAAAQRDIVRWEPSGPGTGVEGWLARTGDNFGRDSERFRVARETRDLHHLEGAMWDKDAGTVATLTKDYFARPPDGVSDRVLNTALANLARFEPGQALELAQTNLAARPSLDVSVPIIIRDWAGRDLGAPGDWLNAHRDSPLYDSATVVYATEMKKENPTAATAWAGTIKSPTLRNATIKRLSQ